MTASWLAQLGWEVYVLDGFDGALETGSPRLPAPPPVETLSPRDLIQALADEAVVVVDLAPSPRHRKGHVPGAWFAIRAQLPEALAALPTDKAIVLTSPDGALATLAASELEEGESFSAVDAYALVIWRWAERRQIDTGNCPAWSAKAARVHEEGGVTGAQGNSTGLVGTPEQVAESLLDYYDLGVSTFLIRGFDPAEDAIAYGRDPIPLVRQQVAERDLRLARAAS